MDHMEFESLVAQSNDYLRAALDRVIAEFDIGSFPRYDYHLLNREIWWRDSEGEPVVRAKILPVGTISTQSKTWLWAWANPQLENVDLGAIEEVRQFGEDRELTKLTEEMWEASEVDGWEMTAIASRLLESAGAYRSPNKNGFLYLVFEQPERIPEGEKERYRMMTQHNEKKAQGES